MALRRGVLRRPDPAVQPRPRLWQQRAALLVALFGIYVVCPNGMVTDSIRTVSVAENMVYRHTINLDHQRDTMPTKGYGVDMVDGHVLPRFPWAGAVFAVPLIVGYDALHRIGVGPGTEGAIAASGGNDLEFQLVTMGLVVAATAVIMWEVAVLALAGIADVRRRRRLALVAALVFALCTSALSTAARSYWEHGPDIFFLSIALLLAVRSRTQPDSVRWLGVPLAAAFAVRPTSAIPVALFTLWMLVQHRRYLLWYFGGAAVIALPWLGINHANWGTWLTPYYLSGQIVGTGEFWQALAGTMVSPARGLLIFSPVLALAVPGVVIKLRRRSFDSLDAVLVGSVLLHWLLIAVARHWWGGDSYGPRLWTDMVPFLVVLGLPVLEWLSAAPVRALGRTATIAACTLAALISLFVNGQMAVFASSACWNDVPTHVDQDTTKLWNWGDPQFLRGVVRFVAGPPSRSDEVSRGGAGANGCPWEPQVTGGPQAPPAPG